ncbi:hypothetical protein GCM10009582_09360 [Arthrobacter flavus]
MTANPSHADIDRPHSGRTSPGKHVGKYDVKREREYERVLIFAARLRITTDSKLGKPTPHWVLELANRSISGSKPAKSRSRR